MFPRSGGEKVYLEAVYKKPKYLATVIFASNAILLGFTASGCIVSFNIACYPGHCAESGRSGVCKQVRTAAETKMHAFNNVPLVFSSPPDTPLTAGRNVALRSQARTCFALSIPLPMPTTKHSYRLCDAPARLHAQTRPLCYERKSSLRPLRFAKTHDIVSVGSQRVQDRHSRIYCDHRYALSHKHQDTAC